MPILAHTCKEPLNKKLKIILWKIFPNKYEKTCQIFPRFLDLDVSLRFLKKFYQTLFLCIICTVCGPKIDRFSLEKPVNFGSAYCRLNHFLIKWPSKTPTDMYRRIRTQLKICFYYKIHNFYPIITKLSHNNVLMSTLLCTSFVMMGQKLWIF